MSSNSKLISVVGGLLVLVTVGIELLFQPRIAFHSEQKLVRADEPAVELLNEARPLEEIKQEIQKSGKHVDAISWLEGSLLYWAAKKRRLDVAQWLLSKGANPNGIDLGMPPLQPAIVNQDLAMVKLLLMSSADPDLGPASGVTPRGIAKSVGNPEIIAALPPVRKTKPSTSVKSPPED